MIKKSKKKQIVAMTLALSVLSSSVGMCGASAAEALPDTDDSGLRVTVVPLADSNADTDTPADDTKTEKQPVASTDDNTDQRKKAKSIPPIFFLPCHGNHGNFRIH